MTAVLYVAWLLSMTARWPLSVERYALVLVLGALLSVSATVDDLRDH